MFAVVLRTLTAVTFGWLGSTDDIVVKGGTVLRWDGNAEVTDGVWVDAEGVKVLLPLDPDGVLDEWVVLDDEHLANAVGGAAAMQQVLRDGMASILADYDEAIQSLRDSAPSGA